MDAADLARWTRFASKGGIGRCTALGDCVAQDPEDLMFLKGDEIVVLMQLPSPPEHTYLGYCEGVVGRFTGADVQFHGKLKKPVLTKSTASPPPTGTKRSSRPISSQHIPIRASSSSPSMKSPSSLMHYEDPGSDPGPTYRNMVNTSPFALPLNSPGFPRESITRNAAFRSSSLSGAPQITRTFPSTNLRRVGSESPLRPDPNGDQLTPSTLMVNSIRSDSPEETAEDGESRSNETAELRRDSSHQENFSPNTSGNIDEHDLSSTSTVSSFAPHTPAQPASVSHDEGLVLQIPESSSNLRGPVNDESDSEDVVLMERNFKRRDGLVSQKEGGLTANREREGTEKSLLLPSRTFAEDDTPPSSAGLEPPSPAGFIFGRGAVEPGKRTEEVRPVQEEGRSYDESEDSRSESGNRSAEEDEDGEFGIGWNLLKGLEGDGGEDTIDGHGGNYDDDSDEDLPPPPTLPPVAPLRPKPVTVQSTNSIASSTSRSNYSESEGGGGGGYYEDLDIYDDYRYSRYSRGSSELLGGGSRRSRSGSVAESMHAARGRSSTDSLAQSESRPPLPQGLTPLTPLTPATPADPPLPLSPAPVPRGPLLASELRSRIEAERRTDSPVITSPPPASSSPPRLTASPVEMNSPSPSSSRSPSRASSRSPSPPPAPPQTQLSPVMPLFINKGPRSPSLPTNAPPPQVTPPAQTSTFPSLLPPPPIRLVDDTSAPPSPTVVVTSHPPSPLPPGPSPLPPPLPPPSPVAFAFPPHPNASKLLVSIPQTPLSPPRQPAIRGPPPTPSATQTSLHTALTQASSPKLPEHLATIIGRTEIDLLSASDPVPIAFVVKGQEALLPPVRSPNTLSPPSPLHPPIRPVLMPPRQSDRGILFPPPSPTIPTTPAESPRLTLPAGPSTPIPRNPQFLPKVGQPRPRSQSFSGFGELSTNKPPNQAQAGLLGSPLQLRVETTLPLSSSPSSPALPSSPAPFNSNSNSGSPAPPPLPTPISSNDTSPPRRVIAKPSPLFIANPSPPSSIASPGHPSFLRSPAPASPMSPRSTAPTSPDSLGPPVRRPIRHASSHVLGRPPANIPFEMVPSPSPGSAFQVPPTPDSRASSATPSSPNRTTSLKSKMSISALRAKVGSPTPSPGYDHDEETVQVQDMEFELIKPVMNRPPEDDDKENFSASKESMDDNGRRSNSALGSRAGHSSFDSMPPSSFSDAKHASSPLNHNSIEAHRARELAWISAMKAGGKNSKKIRKLVLEDVPTSVRGVVWLYLTEAKARRMDGLYTQLGKRGRVTATDEIERDVPRCFPDHEHLRDPKGPLVSVLQAYLSMVPDLRYNRGLAIIAGAILLQSPEEDAFWTLVCLMDNHIRGYWSPSAMLMDVDSSLFGKALQAADPTIAHRLFVDLNINPIDLCRPWFLSLFSDVLPSEHLLRLWDVFLFEGPFFLFRLGLAVLSISRPFLLELSRNMSSSEVLAYLIRPPPTIFPSDPNTLISLCFSVKFKEEELRKLRPKVEAQMKQQRAAASR